jgi:hypothetical protein
MTAVAQPETRTSKYIFMGLVVVMAALTIPMFWAALAFPVIAWLPSSVLDKLFGVAGAEIHRIHGVGFSVQLWLMVGSVVVQLHRPRRKVALMWAAGSAMAISVVIEIIIGTFDPFALMIVIMFAVLAWIHPGDLTERPQFADGPLKSMAWLGAVGTAIFAGIQLHLQLSGGPANPHVAMGHYGGMAETGLMIGVAALIAATDTVGARLVAWFVGLGTVFYGVASVAYPDHASSLGVVWGLVAAVWGVAFLVLSEREARARQPGSGTVLEGVR